MSNVQPTMGPVNGTGSCNVFTKDYETIKAGISITFCIFGVVYTFFGK